MTAMLLASLFLLSCGEPAANNTANKPANAVNNAVANTASTANNEADVKKLMTELGAALAKNDAAAASKFYADDYHLVNPQGVDQTKSARMADMTSGATKFDTFAYENVSVRSYGDTAVAISDVKATGKTNGQPVAASMKVTLALVKMKDGWKVVSGQATPVTGAAAAAPASNTAASNTAANKPANAAPANK
jgi:uncharacterized protein (TIGR02246 family)